MTNDNDPFLDVTFDPESKGELLCIEVGDPEDEKLTEGRSDQVDSIPATFMKLAMPTTILFSAISLSNFFGAYILSRTGDDGVAASGLFSSLQMLLQSFTYSYLFVIGPLTGGADNSESESAIVKSSAIFIYGNLAALTLAIPMTTFYGLSKQFFDLTGQDPAVSQIAADAFDGYVWGCWADVALIAISQYALAKNEGLATLAFTVVQRAPALILAYHLVLGVNGCDKMGAKGLGMSYSIFSVISAILFSSYLYLKKHWRLISLSDLRNNVTTLKNIVQYGWPISLHMGSELAVLAWLIQMSGQINAESLIATEIVCQYAGFSIAVTIGLSQGASILVSKHAGQPEKISEIMRLAMISASMLTALTAVFFTAIPKQLTGVFFHPSDKSSQGQDISDPDEVYQIATWIFIIMAVSNLPDNYRNIHTGALRGLFDTQAPMIANVAQSVVNLALAYTFVYTTNLDASGLFIARGVSIALLSAYLWKRWEGLRPKVDNTNITNPFTLFKELKITTNLSDETLLIEPSDGMESKLNRSI